MANKPQLNRTLQMHSNQASDRFSSQTGDSQMGDTGMSDNSLLSDSSQGGTASPLDLPKKTYAAHEDDISPPIAGGGYTHSPQEEASNAAALQRQKLAQSAQFTGESPMSAGDSGPNASPYRQPGTRSEMSEDAPIADDSEDPEYAGNHEASRAIMDQQNQTKKSIMGKAQDLQNSLRDAKKKINDAKEKIKKYQKNVKRVRQAIEAEDFLGEIEDMFSDFGATFILFVLQLNIQAIGKYFFNSKIVTQDLWEDFLTVCIDFFTCGLMPFLPPCCFITIPLILFLAMSQVVHNNPALDIVLKLMNQASKIH